MTKSTGWRVAGLLAASALACSAAASEGTAHWNHDPAGPTGPDAWGTLSFPHATCGGGEPFVEVGMKQSPVDIQTGRVVAAPLPAIEFGYRETAFVVENTGHDVKVPYQPGSSIAVGQAGYDLLQLHVHARSEHTVDGRHAAAEIHLVHQDRLLDLAVVGLRVEVGTPVNVVADAMIRNASTRSGERIVVPGAINAMDLLPVQRDYFAYSGSLTTPPCSEGVRWLLMKQPVLVSQQAIDHLHQVIRRFEHGGGHPDNNRPVRPLNGRVVLERDER